jgi:hypothetical protein
VLLPTHPISPFCSVQSLKLQALVPPAPFSSSTHLPYRPQSRSLHFGAHCLICLPVATKYPCRCSSSPHNPIPPRSQSNFRALLFSVKLQVAPIASHQLRHRRMHRAFHDDLARCHRAPTSAQAALTSTPRSSFWDFRSASSPSPPVWLSCSATSPPPASLNLSTTTDYCENCPRASVCHVSPIRIILALRYAAAAPDAPRPSSFSPDGKVQETFPVLSEHRLRDATIRRFSHLILNTNLKTHSHTTPHVFNFRCNCSK